MATFCGYRNGEMFRPPVIQPDADHSGRSTEMTTPLNSRKSFAGMFDESIRSSVIGLFLAVSPNAIFSRIWAGVVYPLQGMRVVRFSSHVRQEALEISHPFVAHFNASSSVVFERVLVWVIAARFSVDPRPVFCRITFAVDRLTTGFAHSLIIACNP
jgi:hypothetical protein